MTVELRECNLSKALSHNELPEIISEVTKRMGIQLKHFSLDESKYRGVETVKQVIDSVFSRIQANAIPLAASRMIIEFGYDPRSQSAI